VITFDPEQLQERAAALEQEMGAPGFWDDQRAAKKVLLSSFRNASRALSKYPLARWHSNRIRFTNSGVYRQRRISSSVQPNLARSSRGR